MSSGGWNRFGERLRAGDQRDVSVRHWEFIRSFADEPNLETARSRFRTHVDSLEEPEFEAFRNTFIFVYAPRFERTKLSAVSDDFADWLKRFDTYVAGDEPEARHFRNLCYLRSDLDKIRKPPSPPAPLSPDEIRLSVVTSALWGRVAPMLENSASGSSADAIVDKLTAALSELRALVARADSANRMRQHAEEMEARTVSAIARHELARRRYDEARQRYEEACCKFQQLGDVGNVKDCERRLEALRILATGDVDAAVSASLRVLAQGAHDEDSGDKETSVTARVLGRTGAVAALLQKSLDVGDFFAAERLANEALAELNKRGYRDPGLDEVDAAFEWWVDDVPEELTGNDFLAVATKVAEYFTRITQARSDVALHAPSNDSAQAEQSRADGQRAFEQLQRLAELTMRMGNEARAVSQRLQRTWEDMAGKPVEDEATFETRLNAANTEANAAQRDLNNLHRALADLSVKKNARFKAGESLDDILLEAERCQTKAAEMNQLAVVASFAMLRADTLVMLSRPADALPILAAVRAALFPGPDEGRTSAAGAPERATLVDILSYLATTQSMLGDNEAASATCGKAIDEVERDRYSVNSPYLQAAFFGTRAKIFAVGVWSAYKLQDYETMFERMELSKARSLAAMRTRTPVPSLDRSDLETTFRCLTAEIDRDPNNAELLERRRRVWDLLAIERLSARNAEPARFSLEAVRKALDPDEAILYYYWLSRNVFLVAAIDAIKPVVVERVVVKEPERAELEAIVRALSTLKAFNGNLDAGIARFSTTLLPAAIRTFVDAKDVDAKDVKRRLVFSPHRSLHQLPFHALTWTDGPVIERFAVSYAPNLSGLLAKVDDGPPPRVLVVSTDRYEVSGTELNALAGTPLETAEIEAIYREAGVPVSALKDKMAQKAELHALDYRGLLATYRTIHFATHGVSDMNEEPMESKLYLRDAVLDGLEISQLRLRADLVVLSACYAGQRAFEGRLMPELGGDDLFGLQAAFAMAGARAILGSLWVANDTATTSIMIGFHRHLAQGDEPEVALQSAILKYRAGNQQRMGSYYWAPFFISVVGQRIRPKGSIHAESDIAFHTRAGRG